MRTEDTPRLVFRGRLVLLSGFTALAEQRERGRRRVRRVEGVVEARLPFPKTTCPEQEMILSRGDVRVSGLKCREVDGVFLMFCVVTGQSSFG